MSFVSRHSSIVAIVTLAGLAVMSVGFAAPVSAESRLLERVKENVSELRETLKETRGDMKLKVEERIDKMRNQAEEKNNEVQQHAAQPAVPEASRALAPEKLELCRERENRVNATMASINTRNQHVFDKIDAVYAKATAYYQASGKQLENYDSLIAAIEAQKQTAYNGLSVVSSASNFSCADVPLQTIQEFKVDQATEINNLLAYRDTVRALVKAIREAPVKIGGAQQ